MFEAIKKLNENAGSLVVGLAVVGLLLNNTWQISEMRQALSADIADVRKEVTEVRLEVAAGHVKTNTEISGLRERMGVLEVLVRGPEPQASAHTNASAEPSTAREPSPETSGQPRTSARP